MKDKWVVSGNVQGVSFRAFATQLAKRFGVQGSVKNLPDGRVELLVKGEKNKLKGFKKSLQRKGNPENLFSLHVEKIQKQRLSSAEEKKLGTMEHFEIDYGFKATPPEKELLERMEIGSLVLSNFHADTQGNFQHLDIK